MPPRAGARMGLSVTDAALAQAPCAPNFAVQHSAATLLVSLLPPP